MNAILTYIAGVVVCSGLFTGFYRVALHQHASFRTARFFLFFSLVAAAVIPALDIPVWKTAPIEVALTNIPVTAYEVAVDSPSVAAAPDYWQYAAWGAYGLGIAAMITAMGVQMAWIWRIRRRSEIFHAGKYEVALFREDHPSFSFLSTVYMEHGTPPDEMRQIMLHETSHIRHRHSAEKIVMEILKAFMWFNPFAWLASHLLSEVHEFEADRDVLRGGFTVQEYLPVIFKQVFGYTPEISAGLANSLTKKRFKMMTKNLKRGKYSWLRTAGVLPIAAGTLMLFGFTKQAPQIITTEAENAIVPAQEPQKTQVTVMQKTIRTQEDAPESQTTKITVLGADSNADKAADNGMGWIEIHKDGSKTTVKTSGNIKNPDGLFIWDNEQKREMTMQELSAIPADQIKGISVLKGGNYPDEIVQAIGGREVKGVIVIGPFDGATIFTDKLATTDISRMTVMSESDSTASPKSSIREITVIKKSDGTDKAAATGRVTNSFKVNGEWTAGEKPIILIKEKGGYREVHDVDLNRIDPNTIESVSVFKGSGDPFPAEIAKIIGDSKVDGVVVIQSKKNTNNQSFINSGNPFIWLKNEKVEVSQEAFANMDPASIESVSILKDKSAYPKNIRKAMGDREFDGILIVETKQ